MEEQIIDIDGQVLIKTTIYGDYSYINHRNNKGEYHRIGGPAVIYSDGIQEYWVEGKRHRTDGPAYIDINPNGYQAYWVDGKRHRTNGHAIIWPNGTQAYWVNDILYTEEQYPKAVFEYNLKQMLG